MLKGKSDPASKAQRLRTTPTFSEVLAQERSKELQDENKKLATLWDAKAFFSRNKKV